MFLTYHLPGRENSFARANCSAAINSGLEDLTFLSGKVTINDMIYIYLPDLTTANRVLPLELLSSSKQCLIAFLLCAFCLSAKASNIRFTDTYSKYFKSVLSTLTPHHRIEEPPWGLGQHSTSPLSCTPSLQVSSL